jgi:hypothetical protein
MHGSYSKRITINLHEAQYRRLSEAARCADMAIAPYARAAALGYLDQTFVVPPRLDDLLARLIQETRRIGTNLNQIAERANATRRVSDSDLEAATRTVHELEQTTRVLRVVLDNLSPEP